MAICSQTFLLWFHHPSTCSDPVTRHIGSRAGFFSPRGRQRCRCRAPSLAAAALPLLAPPIGIRPALMVDVPTRSSQLDVHDMMLCNVHMH